MSGPEETAEKFYFNARASGRVTIYFENRPVTTLTGRDGEKFLSRIETADKAAAQLLMARVTGNFKRGNERMAKHKRNRKDK